jgi:hypothetical protein
MQRHRKKGKARDNIAWQACALHKPITGLTYRIVIVIRIGGKLWSLCELKIQ